MAGKRIAVIDIGKTNKKVLIFDENLRILDSAYKSFEEFVEGNIHYERVEEAFAWFVEQLKRFSATYSIGALSITTHGATAMCVDEHGNLAMPPVAYTTEADQQFRREFYDLCGTPKTLQQETATAEIGDMINLGKLIFFLQKTWPEKVDSVSAILNYPQYFGYRFTGKKGAEPTFTGCHTYLYDVADQTYSSVADKLGIADKLPWPISKSWDVLGTVTEEMAERTGLSTDCLVTLGIHDSNSSLLPYLVKGHTNFVLNSTGTWCVAMHPTRQVSFQADELGKLVFYNLDAFNHPVKTSIFMGGLEFETYLKLLRSLNQTQDWPEFKADRLQRVVSERKLFILPSVVRGTGLFPDSKPRVVEGDQIFDFDEIQNRTRVPEFFSDYQLACAVLILSLAYQTKTALDMAGFAGAGTIFTEGGFRQNKTYNALLTALYPQATVALTDMKEATAFGAAILGKAALDGTTPMETASCFDIDTESVPTLKLDNLDAYITDFTRHLGR